MIPLEYITIEEKKAVTDLAALVDVVRGNCGTTAGWRALITFSPKENIFIELSSSPPNIRGDSHSVSQQVMQQYIMTQFNISKAQMQAFLDAPEKWELIENF